MCVNILNSGGTPIVHQKLIIQNTIDKENVLNYQQMIPNAEEENNAVEINSNSLMNEPEGNTTANYIGKFVYFLNN